MTPHPAALVLADHFPIGIWSDGRPIRCSCHDWSGHPCDHAIHLADVLDRAGLLAPVETASPETIV